MWLCLLREIGSNSLSKSTLTSWIHATVYPRLESDECYYFMCSYFTKLRGLVGVGIVEKSMFEWWDEAIFAPILEPRYSMQLIFDVVEHLQVTLFMRFRFVVTPLLVLLLVLRMFRVFPGLLRMLGVTSRLLFVDPRILIFGFWYGLGFFIRTCGGFFVDRWRSGCLNSCWGSSCGGSSFGGSSCGWSSCGFHCIRIPSFPPPIVAAGIRLFLVGSLAFFQRFLKGFQLRFQDFLERGRERVQRTIRLHLLVQFWKWRVNVKTMELYDCVWPVNWWLDIKISMIRMGLSSTRSLVRTANGEPTAVWILDSVFWGESHIWG